MKREKVPGVGVVVAEVTEDGRAARSASHGLRMRPKGGKRDERHPVGRVWEVPSLVFQGERAHVKDLVRDLQQRQALIDARRVFAALSQTLVDVQLIADVPAISGMTSPPSVVR